MDRLLADFVILGFCASGVFRGAVKARAVVPKDFALFVVGQGKFEKALDRVGILRIAVRIIGGKDQLVAAELCDGVARRRFVGLDRYPALALEIFAWLHHQVGHENIAFALVAFVQAPQQPRQPGTVGFEERHAHFRMALKNTSAEESAHAHHLFEGLGINAAQTEVGLEMLGGLARAGSRGFVKAERQDSALRADSTAARSRDRTNFFR